MVQGSHEDPHRGESCSNGASASENRAMGSQPGSQTQPSSNDSHELRDHNLDRHREDDDAPKRPRACMGVLYFNQRRYDKQKPPLCGGWRKKLAEEDVTGQLPTDSVPGGDFKYLCVGYSAYDEEGLKRAAARRSSEADPIVLPYCEGLEVISAAALSRKPELMSAGGPDVNPPSSPEPSSEEGAAPPRQRPGRSFVPGAPELPDGMTLEKFRERFERMAGRIVDKMQSNATFMVGHVKRTYQQIMRELGGGDNDRSRDH